MQAVHISQKKELDAAAKNAAATVRISPFWYAPFDKIFLEPRHVGGQGGKRRKMPTQQQKQRRYFIKTYGWPLGRDLPQAKARTRKAF
ncbi:MAG: hypothetical protein ABIH50_03025 [bacterium]